MKQYCEHWTVGEFGSPDTGIILMQVQCGYPVVGTLNGVPVCEKHYQEGSK